MRKCCHPIITRIEMYGILQAFDINRFLHDSVGNKVCTRHLG